MKAILHTLCGCSREMEVPKRQPHIEVAMLLPQPTNWLREPWTPEDAAQVHYRKRTFELIDEQAGPYGALHYREVV